MVAAGGDGNGADGDVLSVKGTVRLAYPLRQLQQPHVVSAADSFTLGNGPCGDDAVQVMTIMLDNDRFAIASCRSMHLSLTSSHMWWSARDSPS